MARTIKAQVEQQKAREALPDTFNWYELYIAAEDAARKSGNLALFHGHAATRAGSYIKDPTHYGD